jgi:molecular chaperone DnaJ
VKLHPDKNPGDKHAEDNFKELGEAYEAVSDPDKRAAYDRYGHAAFAQGGAARGGGGAGFHDPFDIFREVFGGGGGGGGGNIFEQFFGGGGGAKQERESRQRGSDLRYDMQITLEEAAFGAEKEIEVSKPSACGSCNGTGAEKGSRVVTCSTCGGRGQVVTSRGFFQVAQTCPRCRGSGQTVEKPCGECRGEGRSEQSTRIKLKIPAGIEDGSRLRSTGNGEAGVRGGQAGDLYVVIHVKEHEIFEREDSTLFCDLPISFAMAALGGEIKVNTLHGEASLKIPAGTQSGTTFKLRGKGMPELGGGDTGDLHVRTQIAVPKKLTSEQKHKLQEFAELLGDEVPPAHKSFLDRAREFFQ